MEGVQTNTVWTWNAVGKQAGAWGLEDGASEATAGFLLNHLISELLPEDARRREAAHQFRSGDGAGGVVRPARQRHQVRARRDRHLADVPPAKRIPGDSGARPGAALRREMSGDASQVVSDRLRGERRCGGAATHSIPQRSAMKLGLLIDLDVCVGCHACATACKEWNAGSGVSGPLSDYQPFGAEPSGVWFNRVRHYEVGEYPANKTINFPLSCMHCEDADA